MTTSSTIRLCTVLLVSAGLAGACKKNEDRRDITGEPTAPTDPTVEGRRDPSSTVRRTAKPATEPVSGVAMAAKYMECIGYLNAGNFDAFRDKCLTADLVAHQVDDRDINGADGFVSFLQGLKTGIPDLKMEPQLVIINGRNLMAVTLMTGTHRGMMKTPIGDISPTNKKIGQLSFHRVTINDDLKASEEWSYMDPATHLGQLGKLPKLPTRKVMQTGIEGAPMIVIAADDAKERANVATVTKWNQLFSAHKMDELMALYADNAIESDQADPVDWKGKREIQRGNQRFFTGFSDGRVEVQSLFPAGDYVVSIGRFTGTNDGDMNGMKKTGKKVAISYAEVIKVMDGKVVEVRRFRNGLAMANQLGLMQEMMKQPAGTMGESMSPGMQTAPTRPQPPVQPKTGTMQPERTPPSPQLPAQPKPTQPQAEPKTQDY